MTSVDPQLPDDGPDGDGDIEDVRNEIAEIIRSEISEEDLADPDSLPERIAEIVGGRFESHSIEFSSQYSGPRPSPEMLAGYERVTPGLSDRIVLSTEKEQEHRHSATRYAQVTHRMIVESEVSKTKLGQILAFVITMTAILGGIILIAIDKDIYGLTAIIGALVSLVVAFIAGKYLTPIDADED